MFSFCRCVLFSCELLKVRILIVLVVGSSVSSDGIWVSVDVMIGIERWVDNLISRE